MSFVFFLRLLVCGLLLPVLLFLESSENVAGVYRLELDYAAGRYIALDENYGMISFFAVPEASLDSVHFLVDASALKLENSNWAASFGLGLRKWDEKRNKAYGLNVFYDYRNQRRNSFNQVGVGLEVLSSVWELHLNGYLPVGRQGYRYSKHILDNFSDDFLATVRKHQYALYGVEISGGRRFWLGDELTIYVAPGFYYYNNKNVRNIQGIQGNAEVAWNDWVSFRLNASYDTQFRGRVQGIFSLSLPLEGLCSCICSSCESLILGRPIRRNDTIFLRNCRSIESNWDECGVRQ